MSQNYNMIRVINQNWFWKSGPHTCKGNNFFHNKSKDISIVFFNPLDHSLPLPIDFVSMAKSSFKLEHPLERRQAEAARIREKYPDRIPVIVERADKSDVPDIDKKKYLVPADLTVGQFVYVVRKRIKLGPEKAIFIFVKNILPPTAAMMSAIYDENHDEDGFLYMTYSGENTFGIH
ncbi:hypothetical protein ES288_D12G188500v1 [Gossypium darwinii]|uniref:Autophagy-related protein n=1 Tax=Gossypium darwinii TaxID=34276 RepID=A0A5D2ABR9_GOSDA|nr:hypothetical protein ES288_D12G188500v1 [Gossypium darwinii]